MLGELIDFVHRLSPQTPELRLLVAGVVIIVAASRLSKYGGIFSDKLGLGEAVIGLIFLSLATSLPELVTSVSAAAVQHRPNLCYGNNLGSCLFNLSILATVDLVAWRRSIFVCPTCNFCDSICPDEIVASRRASFTTIGRDVAASGAFSLVLIAVVAVGLAAELARPGCVPHFLGVGLESLGIFVVYVVGVSIVTRMGKKSAGEDSGDEAKGKTGDSLGWTFAKYGLVLVVILWAGLNLSKGGDDLAKEYGLSRSFVGTLFLALATSLPELVTSIASAWRGAYALAFGNIFGANAFNIVILAMADVFYRGGAVAPEGSTGPGLGHNAMLIRPDGPSQFITIFFATASTVALLLGIILIPKRKLLRLSWPSWALLASYVTGMYLLFALTR